MVWVNLLMEALLDYVKRGCGTQRAVLWISGALRSWGEHVKPSDLCLLRSSGLLPQLQPSTTGALITFIHLFGPNLLFVTRPQELLGVLLFCKAYVKTCLPAVGGGQGSVPCQGHNAPWVQLSKAWLFPFICFVTLLMFVSPGVVEDVPAWSGVLACCSCVCKSCVFWGCGLIATCRYTQWMWMNKMAPAWSSWCPVIWPMVSSTTRRRATSSGVLKGEEAP